MRMRPLGAVVLALSLSGCALAGQSKGARMQDAAQELNLNTRFGRMELAAEHVSEKARAKFFDSRKAWGGAIRVADYELAGLSMKGEGEAETLVKIAWYRANEGDLKVTTLKQKWRDFKGDWKLTEEARIDGEHGLLGDQAPASAADPGQAAPRRTQFPTIRLGSGAALGEAPPPLSPPRSETTIPADPAPAAP